MSWCPGEPAIPGKHLELSTQVMFPTHGGDLYWERSSDLAPKPHRDMRLTCWRWMRKCGPYSRLRQVDPNFIRECAFLNSTTRIVLLLLGEWGVRTKIRPCSLPKLCKTTAAGRGHAYSAAASWYSGGGMWSDYTLQFCSFTPCPRIIVPWKALAAWAPSTDHPLSPTSH